MKRAIGVFDSGVGGLTVVNTLRNILENEDIIYIGDNHHSPYGNKTVAQLYRYASTIIEYLIAREVKMIILACNTTSANVLEQLQNDYPDVLMIGVIDATVNDFMSRNLKSTLIIATQATVNSLKYSGKIRGFDPDIVVHEKATPELVPLVESGKYKSGIEEELHGYLDEYHGEVESIILGCTHYPILVDQILKVMPGIRCISSSQAIGYEVHDYLKDNNLLNDQGGEIEVCTTGDVGEFLRSSQGFFDYGPIEVKYLKIGE
ncbi:MAG: glutamate racemase [Erysipelotrichaceae bacterium]|nr:glutamate racemase [Erysipelotrichaceae bacterium]MDD3809636.1 glutamate racemase [Erysipelotrichaceae bacterium]